MVLELHPITNPSDFTTFVHIQHAAFQNGMTRLLKPTPSTTQTIAESAQKHIDAAASEPDLHFLKVVDTELDGKIIACAKWRINERERTKEEIKVQLPTVEEKDGQVTRDFWGYLGRMREEYMGTKPFYLLHVLVTDPEHQKRGAGSMLLKWGTEKADAAGLPSYLEATEAGLEFYRRAGFVGIHTERFDLAKYGGVGKDSSTVMIRQPAGEKGRLDAELPNLAE
ncbi:hypothetical protein TWF694_000742 [Orbilia ellipsospora]|uniref:N-acetyltransferase domain-containing protein n=1 Tax=Orbilia ellipsospora TaxID=2528407 RepID=A0AAV9XPN5_9PEZI